MTSSYPKKQGQNTGNWEGRGPLQSAVLSNPKQVSYRNQWRAQDDVPPKPTDHREPLVMHIVYVSCNKGEDTYFIPLSPNRVWAPIPTVTKPSVYSTHYGSSHCTLETEAGLLSSQSQPGLPSENPHLHPSGENIWHTASDILYKMNESMLTHTSHKIFIISAHRWEHWGKSDDVRLSYWTCWYPVTNKDKEGLTSSLPATGQLTTFTFTNSYIL